MYNNTLRTPSEGGVLSFGAARFPVREGAVRKTVRTLPRTSHPSSDPLPSSVSILADGRRVVRWPPLHSPSEAVAATVRALAERLLELGSHRRDD